VTIGPSKRLKRNIRREEEADGLGSVP
jgi:hypothetical protein